MPRKASPGASDTESCEHRFHSNLSQTRPLETWEFLACFGPIKSAKNMWASTILLILMLNAPLPHTSRQNSATAAQSKRISSAIETASQQSNHVLIGCKVRALESYNIPLNPLWVAIPLEGGFGPISISFQLPRKHSWYGWANFEAPCTFRSILWRLVISGRYFFDQTNQEPVQVRNNPPRNSNNPGRVICNYYGPTRQMLKLEKGTIKQFWYPLRIQHGNGKSVEIIL